jgi:hypothetical protein
MGSGPSSCSACACSSSVCGTGQGVSRSTSAVQGQAPPEHFSQRGICSPTVHTTQFEPRIARGEFKQRGQDLRTRVSRASFMRQRTRAGRPHEIALCIQRSCWLPHPADVRLTSSLRPSMRRRGYVELRKSEGRRGGGDDVDVRALLQSTQDHLHLSGFHPCSKRSQGRVRLGRENRCKGLVSEPPERLHLG